MYIQSWGASSSALSPDVQGNYMEGGCFSNTSGTYTPLTRWWSLRKGISRGVNGVQCRLTLRTPDISGRRSDRPGWSGSYKEKQRYVWHWPYAASSWSTGMCWNALRYLNTLVACSRRTLTTHRLFNNSCKKHGEYGPMWGNCYAGKTLPQRLLLNSTKQ